MAKRRIFTELMEGVAAMQAHREGKITLRSYKVKPVRLPRVNGRTIRETDALTDTSIFIVIIPSGDLS